MLAPILFNDTFDLFDHFTQDPWFGFNDRDFDKLEKKLYGHRAKNVMNTDIKETDNSYEMTIDLPGFKKEEVNVSLENGYLTIEAAKGMELDDKKDKQCNYIRHERYSGSCQRSFYVGDALNSGDIKAHFEHGILTLTVPKKEQQVAANKYISIEG